MSTICRTCLQKSSTTFKTNQTITDFGGGEVKISMVLRFCMPELYLGLSSNPEICSQCKENLTVAYLFKKKCLHTENMIGTFLKNARCTARSVELDDVLAYFNEQVELELKVDKAIKQSLSLNAQDILSEWDDVPDEALNSEKVIPEVPQPIPSPTKPPRGNKRKMKFCHEMGLFFDPEGNYYDCSGYLVDKDQIEKEKAIAQKEINVEETPTTPDVEPITRDCPDFVQNVESSENFCKITSVFSLCSEDTNKDLSSEDTNKDLGSGTNDADKIDEASNLNNANNANQSSVDVKDEPLEVEINGERIDFNYTATDEETLDASETASYEDMSSTSRLQGIIDNLPEIADTNQYVDVPEFVHINNFGLKELEELRRQQQNEATAGNQKIVLNFKNKLPNSPPPEPSSSGGIVTEKSKEEKKAHSYYTKVPLSTLPETLLINGKKMVKCAEGYKLMDSSGSKPKILSPVTKVMKSTNSATQENYGWDVASSGVRPIICGCRSGCKTQACSCRKLRIKCTTQCKFCISSNCTNYNENSTIDIQNEDTYSENITYVQPESTEDKARDAPLILLDDNDDDDVVEVCEIENVVHRYETSDIDSPLDESDISLKRIRLT